MMPNEMNGQYVLSIDQGTTGTKVLMMDRKQNVLAQSYQTHTQHYPQPGYVEHDPLEIWESVKMAVKEALRLASVAPRAVYALGLSNQGETVMFWHRESGQPLSPAIVWSCKRSASIAKQWHDLPEWRVKVKQKTGLSIDPYYSATKISWMMREYDAVAEAIKAGKAVCGTLDSWLIWKMTNQASFVTDRSTAARTLCYNITSHKWDEEILAYLNIQSAWLPDVLDSVAHFGMTDPEHFCGIQAPIRVSLVDQPAALYGHHCHQKGMAKCTYGTGCFVYMNMGNELPVQLDDQLSATIAWSNKGQTVYALDGGVLSAGSVINWAMKQLALFQDVQQLQQWSEQWSAQLNRQHHEQLDEETLLFVPSFNGLGAPYWLDQARGIFLGLSHRTGKQEMTKAILQGIAHRVTDVIEAMEQKTGSKIERLRVGGGPSVNPYLMQFQAELLKLPIEVQGTDGISAMGVALLLGAACGWWDENGAVDTVPISAVYEPRQDAQFHIQHRLRWKRGMQLMTAYYR